MTKPMPYLFKSQGKLFRPASPISVNSYQHDLTGQCVLSYNESNCEVIKLELSKLTKGKIVAGRLHVGKFLRRKLFL